MSKEAKKLEKIKNGVVNYFNLDKPERLNKFDYKDWLKEIVPYENEECYVKNREGESSRERFYIYTRDHVYAITVRWEKGKKGYMGCVVSCRKPRAGEDWTRGNDLPDGAYCYETWIKIKNAIIKHELVKVAKKVRNVPECCEVVGEDKADDFFVTSSRQLEDGSFVVGSTEEEDTNKKQNNQKFHRKPLFKVKK